MIAKSKVKPTLSFKCASCGRRLRGRWVVGRDRRITGGIPRYCWPGEGCNR